MTYSYEICTGRRKYQVWFNSGLLAPGGVVQLLASFAIGPHRGFLFYPGQPVTCRKCGVAGHTKAVCVSTDCHVCGSPGHVALACKAPKLCSLCGGDDHLYRGCTLRRRTFADLFTSSATEEEQDEAGDGMRGEASEGVMAQPRAAATRGSTKVAADERVERTETQPWKGDGGKEMDGQGLMALEV